MQQSKNYLHLCRHARRSLTSMQLVYRFLILQADSVAAQPHQRKAQKRTATCRKGETSMQKAVRSNISLTSERGDSSLKGTASGVAICFCLFGFSGTQMYSVAGRSHSMLAHGANLRTLFAGMHGCMHQPLRVVKRRRGSPFYNVPPQIEIVWVTQARLWAVQIPSLLVSHFQSSMPPFILQSSTYGPGHEIMHKAPSFKFEV